MLSRKRGLKRRKSSVRRRYSERRKLLIKADKLFREAILSERPYICEWCGKQPKVLHVAHILPKGHYPRLRYIRTNVLLLCFYCHTRWHKSPLEAIALMERRGVTKEQLFELARSEASLPKLTNLYLREISNTIL